jgi:hypothetical protein
MFTILGLLGLSFREAEKRSNVISNATAFYRSAAFIYLNIRLFVCLF